MSFGQLGAGFARLGLGAFGSPPMKPMPKWAAAKAARAAGTRNTKIVCLGDSTTAGAYALSGADAWTNVLPSSYPHALAALIGSTASVQTFCGSNQIAVAQGVYDTRITTPWSQHATATSIGGKLLNSNGATVMNFTSPETIDRIELWYPTDSGLGTFNVKVDGGAALATISQVAAQGIGTQVVNCTLNTHAVQFTRTAGLALLSAAAFYNSAIKRHLIFTAGWSGGKAADLNGQAQAYGAYGGLAALQPDLTIICCTINDWVAATDTTAYTASMQSIISKALETGDVILMTGAPSDAGVASIAQQQIYIDICAALAASNGLNFINLTQRWGSYVQANADGKMSNTAHPNALGYSDQAAAPYTYMAAA